jgi:hypothetical protein
MTARICELLLSNVKFCIDRQTASWYFRNIFIPSPIVFGTTTVPWGAPESTWTSEEASPYIKMKNTIGDGMKMFRKYQRKILAKWQEWSKKWLMRFNAKKCYVMRLKRSRQNIVSINNYNIDGSTLEEVEHHVDVVYAFVEISQSLFLSSLL